MTTNGLTPRKMAIRDIADRQPKDCDLDYTAKSVNAIFGENVFSSKAMRDRLPKGVFGRFQSAIQKSEPLGLDLADAVASAMKDWAIEKGATHYTHWFQPMTGLTAEKHDSFLSFGNDGQVLSEFSGKMLIKGEPDASSFPSGGLRSTFEARGYTAWDPTSPAFLMENVNGKTLCIPTAFCSYTGEALDRKTPLLRSIEALSRQALRILRLFGNTSATSVTPTVGPEQEYFLVDRKLFLMRPDLVNAGRTLIGSRPPKGQELEDHYFGSIRPRVLAFMMDFEQRLFKLGIPVKTRHNEVSPAQFEIAPIFEPCNIAIDHNMIVMDLLKATADEHGLVCLLHEKPFAGVNGSGKHNNWSISDSQGHNLLEPGETPHDNAQFLVFLAAILRAVHQYSPLIRLATVGAGNDHRLGANEAPPAIISAFLGSQLTEVVENLIDGKKQHGKHGGHITIGVSSLPQLPKDTTDRNRTSPFAFTGNKFEFRAVGSSMSVAPANISINTAVAAALEDVANELEKAVEGGKDFNSAIQKLLHKLFKAHQPIIFNGDNYTSEWQKEAERRGLPNLRNSVEALEQFTSPELVKVLTAQGVFTEREIHARQEILAENYCKSISIEAQLTVDMGCTMVVPAALAYQKQVAESLIALRQALGEKADVTTQKALLERLTKQLTAAEKNLSALDKTLGQVDAMQGEALERARAYRDKVVPLMAACRAAGDELEQLVDDTLWPLPKYRELLWIY